jgi:hypothetical protein
MPEALSSPLGTAVVTGASAGIGAATARYLRSAGFDVVIGARRMDRLNEVADGIGARALPLDVTDPASVEAFTSAVESCSVLVNNAGGALGLDRVADSSDEQWSEMYEGRRDLPWPGGDGVQPGPLRRRRATGGGRLRAGRCDGTSAGCGFRTAVPPPVAAGRMAGDPPRPAPRWLT